MGSLRNCVLFLFIYYAWACMPNGASDQVTLGKETYICIYLGPLNWTTTGQYYRLATTVNADKLAKIKVPNSWTSKFYSNDTLLQSLSIADQEASGVGLGVTVGSMGILSYQRVYRQVAYQQYSPAPTSAPIRLPSVRPSRAPSIAPSATPTISFTPSASPSLSPSISPSQSPTPVPTAAPSASPQALLVAAETGADLAQRNLLAEPLAKTHQNQNQSETTTDPTYSITFPVLFAIVSVQNGKVKSVVWDNFCSWCSSDKCVPNTMDYNDEIVPKSGGNCFMEDSECQVNPTESNSYANTTELCELTVYISWKGTDSSGANFQSAAARFSRWSSIQMTDYTSSLQGTAATS